MVKRNFIATLDKSYLIWQFFFPIIYIFVVGYAYTSIIEGVNLTNLTIPYPVFIASGMIGFNVMNSSMTAGVIIWNDKRNGMFEQILMGPFSRTDYIISCILTIVIIGIVGGISIIIISAPILFSNLTLSLSLIMYLTLAIVLGSIFFGSLAIIISIRIKKNESFQVILNLLFILFAFISTTFYPMQGVPEPLKFALTLNPLSHVVDIIRVGLFNLAYPSLYLEVIYLLIASIVTFGVATILLIRLESS